MPQMRQGRTSFFVPRIAKELIDVDFSHGPSQSFHDFGSSRVHAAGDVVRDWHTVDHALEDDLIVRLRLRIRCRFEE
jgi:hypothetical protein